MEYQLTCECGKVVTVTRSQAGQELACECGKTVKAPTLRGFADLPLANDPDATRADDAGGQSVWRGWRGPTIAVASAGMLIAIGFCSVFLLQRSMIDTDYTIETELARGNEFYDTYDPEELSLAWNNFEEYRLGPRTLPEFHKLNLIAEKRLKSAIVSGVIAGCFAVLALATWISANIAKRRRAA